MAVRDIPVPRSYAQTLGEMLNHVTSTTGIRRVKKGNPILSVLEAAASSDIRNTQDTFNTLETSDLDNCEGVTLDRAGADEGAPRFLQAKATGNITISDTSFTKLSSKVFPGTAAPIVGSVVLNVEDALNLPSTGDIYIGRGTPNVEGPLTYASKTDNGSYWTLNLSTPTTKFHNKGESVVLAQGGNRSISSGQLVATAQGALATAVQFSVVFNTVIPDGETEVSNVVVLCTVPGAVGNVPADSIKTFVGGSPFPGAAVTNPKPYISGRDTEQDNSYRDRIRAVRNSRQRGTDLALENAVLGAVSPDENKRVSSSSILRRRGQPSYLFIDDGSGYEETWSGVGLEVVVDDAVGGESDFQTLNRPVAKAMLLSGNAAPYTLSDGAKLSVAVGGVVTTHAFDVSEFSSIYSASAYEVVASINADPALLWTARTAEGGTKVVLVARAEENEDVVLAEVAAPDVDAAPAFQFSTSRRFTTLLYRNDRLLSKDGSAAVLRSNGFDGWNAFSGTQDITLSVDGTPAVTYSFVDQDFVDASTGFISVGKNSLAAWAEVFNAKVPGITATVEADRLILTSNRGRSARAGLAITGGSLVANFMFSVSSSAGTSRDYTLDRATGQLFLESRLAAGDRLTLGSAWTRAFLETDSIPATSTTGGTMWFAIDGDAEVVAHGVGAATELTAEVDSVLDSHLRISITADSTNECFANVAAGDWLVLWDSDSDLPSDLRKAWRVVEVREVGGLLNQLVIEKPASRAARADGTATKLADGTVLLTGGYTLPSKATLGRTQYGRGVTEFCEVFDPTTGAYTAVTNMLSPRARHTATLLSSGKVFVAGGYDSNGNALATTELYDPATDTWTAGPVLAAARAEHTATLLGSGNVLLAGGKNSVPVGTSVEYDPGTNGFVNSAALITSRYGHCAVLLPAGAGTAGAEAGNVLLLGGLTSGSTKIPNVERYDIGSSTWSSKAVLPGARAYFGAAVAATQKVLVAGDGDPITAGAENQTTYAVYSVDTDSWAGDTTIPGDFEFSDKDLIKVPGTNKVLALYGAVDDGVAPRVVGHKVFDGNALTWADLPDSNWVGGVERSRVALVGISASKVLAFGGFNRGAWVDAAHGPLVATHEAINPASPAWTTADPATALAAGTLGSRGLTFVRTAADLQQVTIDSGSSYTAPTFAAALNDGLEGATADVYRTSRLRVSTNEFGLSGDVLLAASTLGTALPLPTGEVQRNLIGHQASVAAGNSGLGTPQGFRTYRLAVVTPPHISDAERTVYIEDPELTNQVDPPSSGSTLLGVRRLYDGANPKFWQSGYTPGNDPTVQEWGNQTSFRSAVAMVDGLGSNGASGGGFNYDRVRVGLRDDAHDTLAPGQSVVFSSAHAMGADNDLTVVVDGDTETKRFSIPMFRRATPSGSYGSQVTLSDGDATGKTLPQTFGIDYDWDDFALLMKARVKTHSSDATKRILWRFWRHGAEGNYATLRYRLPALPSSDVAVDVTYDQVDPTVAIDETTPSAVGIDVYLNSGAAREASTINANSRLGLARVKPSTDSTVFDVYAMTGFSIVSADRTSGGDPTVLTIQVPNDGTVANGPLDSGILVGDVLWLEMSSPSGTTLFSGSFTVSAVGSFDLTTGQQEITIPAGELNDGTSGCSVSNPGTISCDPSSEVIFDPAITAGDFFRINGDDLPVDYVDNTGRVLSAGRQYVRLRAVDMTSAGLQDVPSWTLVNTPDNISIFAGATKTATQLAAAVNALAAVEDSTCPVTATVTGSGSGIIDQATWEEDDEASAHFRLTDGVNWVQRTVQPLLTTSDTQFLLKNDVDTDLTTDSDWTSEDVRLVPVLARDIVQWLQTPAVTGLWTAAEISLGDNGTAVQLASLTPGSEGSIEVQGGTANSATAAIFGSAVQTLRNSAVNAMYVTVRRSEAEGLVGSGWVAVDATSVQSKERPWSDVDSVLSISADGLWTASAPPYTVLGSWDDVRVQFERIGDFLAIRIPLAINDTNAHFEEGDYVYLCEATGGTSDLDAIATANRGIFRVMRYTTTADERLVWVENPNAIEQVCLTKMKWVYGRSAIPGDALAVNTSKFGVGNRGTWTVTEVGTSTPGGEMFVDNTLRVAPTPQPEVLALSTVFGDDWELVRVIEGVPFRAIKQVTCMVPHPDDGAYVDVHFDTIAGSASINAASGCVVTALDKLEFPLGVFTGVDGYSYNTGLIGEANKVLYGDPSDPATYPGYVSNGAEVLAAGPMVKRIRLALSLRVQSGLATRDLADRVRNSVAAVVNAAGVGESVSISDVVTAAGEVTGVIAVAVVSPTYSSTSDVITVSAGEKPLVLDLESDISITFVGE